MIENIGIIYSDIANSETHFDISSTNNDYDPVLGRLQRVNDDEVLFQDLNHKTFGWVI